MGSKREEERNEKIIRGLMKLPPNRRCINCNNLGPQYVCTNFWTFICTICSGIHREFTHRVKSVSMSKFTAQEVEALQNGGNQRAREIFLKNWDLDRQRQPNSSNVDKVREFIKAVYIDRKYAGGKNSEKPPKDLQSPRNAEDETRRASSYHSFSQSPPYDFQYEDRLNRKHAGSLTRKPGSDHLYERNAASFMYSPGRFSAHLYEDRYTNEVSSSRVSDYSLSSGGDPFKSAPQSPNLQKDDGFSSPASDSSREIVDGLHQRTSSTCSETHVKREIDKAPLPRPQRTVSCSSVGSFEKNSVSFQSTSGSLFDVYSESNLSNVTTHKASPLPFSSGALVENTGGLNLFDDALAVPAPNLPSVVDMFQAPRDGSYASMDLFRSPAYSADLSQNFSKTSSSSSSFISQLSENPPVLDSNQKLSGPSESSNEGWATFDLPQPNPPYSNISDTSGSRSGSEGGMALDNLTSVAPSNTGLMWPNIQHSTVHSTPSLVSNPWTEGLQNVHVPINMPNSQICKAFDDGNDKKQQHGDVQGNLQVSVDNMSSNANQFFGLKTSQDSSADGLDKTAFDEGFSFPTLPSHVAAGSSIVEPIHPFMSDVSTVQQKFGNPFDAPFDSELEAHNTFLDFSTLQAALPSAPLPSYVGGLNDSWFSENHVASPGGMSFMAAQSPSSQLPNVPTQGPVASVGGNPFA